MATNSKTTKNPFQIAVDEVDNEMEVKQTPAEKQSREQLASNEMVKREVTQKTLAQIYASQKKFPVRIAPSYAKYFGRIMRVTINCVAVAIPVNGQVYNIPEEFACECERRMREMDAYELKSRKLADVSNNYEPDIGQLSFF